jgi:hypothetical protein
MAEATETAETTHRDDDRTETASTRSSPSGVDRSLVTWMLSLSPAERLAVAEDWANMVDTFGGADDAD